VSVGGGATKWRRGRRSCPKRFHWSATPLPASPYSPQRRFAPGGRNCRYPPTRHDHRPQLPRPPPTANRSRFFTRTSTPKHITE
jgi:hypothetical protein